NNDHRAKHWKLYKVLAVYWTSSDFMCFSQIVMVLMVGAYRVSIGAMEPGTLLMFMMYVNTYLWPIRHMGRIVSELGKTTVSIERIREILDEKREDESALTPVSNVSGELVFDSVTFKHGESEVLHDVSFTAPAGSTLALLGPSGSGKSTIIHLLLRFFDPVSGSIRIDGRDISTLNRKSARELVSIVMQEPFLFSKSIRENIKLGRHDASDDDMFAATRIASIDSSIQSFEKQYDTVVGERGVTLSGGQRQRVALARAILRNAPILVLDDSLSAVDTHTESMILDALRQRKGKHTTILIAHRLSTLMHADQILVLDHGRIVQRGTHESLVNIDGMYRKLWQIQSVLEDDLRAETEVKEAVMK
ncbi:MAG TPA: ABC transporter ATP-binding protein, partial [Tepidisphaeraceae bacterium]|nr:ABC transporter ATP-binding protein [Tepidisphaeraceae bacterium]